VLLPCLHFLLVALDHDLTSSHLPLLPLPLLLLLLSTLQISIIQTCLWKKKLHVYKLRYLSPFIFISLLLTDSALRSWNRPRLDRTMGQEDQNFQNMLKSKSKMLHCRYTTRRLLGRRVIDDRRK
jgi:hypothetical protein